MLHILIQPPSQTHTPPSTQTYTLSPPILSALHSSAFPLYSMLGIHGFQTKQANKQNNRKTHHPDKLGLGLRERWRAILFALRASSISL